MPRFSVGLTLVLLFFSSHAFAQDLRFQEFQLDQHVKTRVGIMERAHSRGEILFVPGFHDQMEQHVDLFRALHDKGFRVVTFDFPKLAVYPFTIRAAHVAAVEKAFVAGDEPMVIVGSSTGGLLTARMAQQRFEESLSRPPEMIVLIGPSVSVYLHREPSLFTIGNSVRVKWNLIPSDYPVLTVVHDNDPTLPASHVRTWVHNQRRGNGMFSAIGCRLESAPSVHRAVAQYIDDVLGFQPVPKLKLGLGCAAF